MIATIDCVVDCKFEYRMAGRKCGTNASMEEWSMYKVRTNEIRRKMGQWELIYLRDRLKEWSAHAKLLFLSLSLWLTAVVHIYRKPQPQKLASAEKPTFDRFCKFHVILQPRQPELFWDW